MLIKPGVIMKAYRLTSLFTSILILVSIGLFAQNKVTDKKTAPNPDESKTSKTEKKRKTTVIKAKPAFTIKRNTGKVLVLPVRRAIDKTQLFMLRRAFNREIHKINPDLVILDMDTPGGRIDYTKEILSLIEK